MISLTSSQNILKKYVDDILCIDEEVIVVKGDRKINLFSNEEGEEE